MAASDSEEADVLELHEVQSRPVREEVDAFKVGNEEHLVCPCQIGIWSVRLLVVLAFFNHIATNKRVMVTAAKTEVMNAK